MRWRLANVTLKELKMVEMVGWITKKNQFLPYVCDLFGYIDSFTHWRESKVRVKPLN